MCARASRLGIAFAIIGCSATFSPVDAGPSADASFDSSFSDFDSGEPLVPEELVRYLTGNPDDANVIPEGPGLILMGGGTDVDAAFAWWAGYISLGDVVVLRTSGEDGYNDYLYGEMGGSDSVETLLVTSRALANSDYVEWKVATAEAIFIAGGDQAEYLAAWMGTRVEDAIETAWERGAILGGTSAGCAVLGRFVFSAENGTVYSDEALSDPYNEYMTLEEDFLALPLLAGVITDTHFGARDRMGRLVTFLARIVADGDATEAIGLGIDEETALLIGPDGIGEVVGAGSVYLVKSHGTPAVCEPGEPLVYEDLTYYVLSAGDVVSFPEGLTDGEAQSLSAADGELSPADPY